MTLEEKIENIADRLEEMENKYLELSEEVQHLYESFCEINQKMDKYLKEKENDA